MSTPLTFAATPASYASVASAQAQRLASLATGALLDEARLTPKPALVDRRGPGAHRDLSLALLECSALTLQPYFASMARAALLYPPSIFLRETLGALGRGAETAMLVATGGVNTHRGAIWALGLLVAGAASFPASPQELCETASLLASMPDRFAPASASHGHSALLAYGAQGARGEAVAGFPHVHAVGLPALRAARHSGIPVSKARLDALLAIMSKLEDTCLLHRGGRGALAIAQQGAAAVLAAGGSATPAGALAIAQLDAALLAAWASPGGAADLLSATLFVDRVFPEPSRILSEPSHA